MNSLLALAARALTMMVSLFCGIITTRMILGEATLEQYALYTLLTTLPALIAFSDLGSGAVIINTVATSDDIRSDENLRFQLTSVGRILVMFASGVMILNTIMLVSGGWRMLFGDVGDVPGAPLAAFFCVTIFCLGVPVGIWVRILLGLRKNHLVILLQGLISPLTLLGVWLLITFGGPELDSFLAIASFGAAFLVSALGLSLTAARTRPLIPAAAWMLLAPRKHPGVRVMDVGWPMLAQLITYPIAVASQRYVLAQSGSPIDIAEYGVTGQVFFALSGLVTAAGLALWPLFARRRHRGELKRGPFLLSLLFAAGIATATTTIWLIGPWLFDFISNGEIDVRPSTILCFGLMVMMTASIYPLGMFIMDKPGIRFQVIPTLSMAGLSLILSFILTPLIGVVGPLLGTAFALLVCQYIPFLIYIRRHRARLLRGPAAETPQPETEPTVV